jgi:hypothetical protein
MERENKIGVELIKKAIKFFYDLGTEGLEVWKDKKISLAEAIGFSDNAFVAVQLVTKLDQIQAEFKNLDTDTGLELIEYTGELIKGATSEDIDVIVTNAILAIKSEIDIYNQNIVPIIDKIKEIKGRK